MNASITTDSLSATHLLGEIVTWDTKASEIAIDTIRDALTNAGLSDDVAKDLNTRSAFSRATKTLKENRSIDKVKQSKDGVVTFQLTKKEVDEAHDRMDFKFEAIIRLDTKTGDIECPDQIIEDQAKALLAHAMQTRTASDVTRMVQTLFKSHADLFPINPSKGVAYFVPEKYRDFSKKCEAFLSNVGGTLWQFPVPKGTESGNASVRDAVTTGLNELLKELNDAVSDWDDTTRKGTMVKGTEKFKLIKHKAEAYAEYLGHNQATLLAEIDEAKKRLVSRINDLTDTDDDDDEEPVTDSPSVMRPEVTDENVDDFINEMANAN